MHGAPGITNPELPSSAVLVAAACVLASTSVFARGGLGHGGGFANRGGFVRNPTTLLGSQHRGCPLSETGFRPHSRHLRSRTSLPLTRYNQPAEAMEYWRRYLAKDSQSEWAAPGPPA